MIRYELIIETMEETPDWDLVAAIGKVAQTVHDGTTTNRRITTKLLVDRGTVIG